MRFMLFKTIMISPTFICRFCLTITSLLLGLLDVSSGYGWSPKSSATNLHFARIAQRQPTDKSLYLFEGSRVPPAPCANSEAAWETRGVLLAHYVARLQGTKAIISEYCVDEDRLEVPPPPPLGTCSTAHCIAYDTYRRGPVYFARFFAAMNASIPGNSIELWSSKRSLERRASYGSRGDQVNHVERQRVNRQRFKFNLDGTTRCVAQLKIFRDEFVRERLLEVRAQRGIDLSASPNSGLIWAQHRKTRQGYELLIVEDLFSESRGEGEVLERELLCVNSYRPVSAHESFQFAIQEIDRDTLRVYAVPK